MVRPPQAWLIDVPATASKAATAVPSTVGVEPNFLIDIDQFKQVMLMNVDSLKALATAMEIDVDGKSKAALMLDIARFAGKCDSVKSFDVTTDDYEFVELKKQDFHQPAAPQSSA